MNSVYLQPKMFTYTRVYLGKPEEGDEKSRVFYRPQYSEVTETQVAHCYFAVAGRDGLMVHFYESDDYGRFSLLKIVDAVKVIDAGVPA